MTLMGFVPEGQWLNQLRRENRGVIPTYSGSDENADIFRYLGIIKSNENIALESEMHNYMYLTELCVAFSIQTRGRGWGDLNIRKYA